MNLYIDTEFTNFNGELLSLAIVDENNNFFYEVLEYNKDNCCEWVKENVLPVLNKTPISYESFYKRLSMFMANYHKGNFYADWPEDIAYLLRYMCKPEGFRISGEYSFHLIYSGELESKIPHNALMDAFALKHWHHGG